MKVLEPGTSVAGYRIERVLGSGGMGSVYLARHPELPRSDALKVLNASGGAADEQFRKRFLREAEVAATLDHPNIVTIYNRGRAEAPPGHSSGSNDLLWIAMQYVAGTDAAREVDARGRLSPRRVARIVTEIARGLDHAHRHGLLHRDIKPANILLSKVSHDVGATGLDEQRVVLTDFGVAKITDEVEGLTSVGTVLATLSYASPEQLSGERLDGRTDQYSLAATAFHLMAGRVPFDDRDTAAIIAAHLDTPVPKVSGVIGDVPPAVDAVIARAMAKSAADRFGTCREFAAALSAAVHTRPVVRRPVHSAGPPGRIAPPRHRPAGPPGAPPRPPGPVPAPHPPPRSSSPAPPPARRPAPGPQARPDQAAWARTQVSPHPSNPTPRRQTDDLPRAAPPGRGRSGPSGPLRRPPAASGPAAVVPSSVNPPGGPSGPIGRRPPADQPVPLTSGGVNPVVIVGVVAVILLLLVTAIVLGLAL